MAKVTPISEHFQPFLGDLKATFWGDPVRAEETGLAAVFPTAIGAAAGPFRGLGMV